MNELHSVLQRQLKRVGVREDAPPSAEAWEQFLERVNRTYEESDRSRYLLERSLDVSSQEMRALYDRLSDQHDKLAKSEERYRLLIDQSPDAIGVVENGRFTFLNPAGLRLLGGDAEELLDRAVSDFVDDHLLQLFRAMPSGAETRRVEGTLHRTNGGELPIEVTVLKRADSEQDSVQFIARDIRDRREAERELKDAHRQLVQISRQAGMAEVATGVLHNVGNVLNSVNVSVALLQERLKESRISGVKKLADLIAEHEDDLTDFLTNDPSGQFIPTYLDKLATHLEEEQRVLLTELSSVAKSTHDIERIISTQQSAGQGGLVVDDVVPCELLDEAIRLFRRPYERGGIDLTVSCECEGVMLETDRHRVLVILHNLLSNARHAVLDASESEPLVTVELTVDHDEDVCEINVSDNGVGIEEENLTDIFAYGFSTKPSGHGFGLHSSALAAKELGGTLSCESEGRGRGSTFTLELPLEHPDDPSSVTHS